jgi:sensor histidine kinase YesM
MTKEHLNKNIRMLIVCTMVGILLFALGWAGNLAISLLISNAMGFTVRYCKIWLAKAYPDLNLSLQYGYSALIAIVVWGFVPILIRYQFNPEAVNQSLGQYVTIIFVCIIVVAIISYLYYRNEQFYLLQQELDKAEIARVKQDKKMLETQLRLLQSQIEPHFLFNTLANIQALINIEPKSASKMLMALTSLLRQSLNRTRDESLTLSHELRFNKAYLAIQQIRLGDRLRVEFDVSDQIVDNMLFPPLLLQPLIENAVVHGIEPMAEGGLVKLSIHIEDSQLHIEIYNDCALEPVAPTHKGHGVGLTNIRERLEQIYHGEATLAFDKTQTGSVTVTMEIPINV